MTFNSTSTEAGFVKIGDTANLTCDANARLSGSEEYTCSDQDTWTPDFDATCTVGELG